MRSFRGLREKVFAGLGGSLDVEADENDDDEVKREDQDVDELQMNELRVQKECEWQAVSLRLWLDRGAAAFSAPWTGQLNAIRARIKPNIHDGCVGWSGPAGTEGRRWLRPSISL